MAKRSGFQIQKLSQGHALLLLHFRGSNQTLQSLEWQQSVEQADIRHPGTCVTSGSRPEAEQCGTLLAALPQEDAHPEAAQRLILKDGHRKSISCLPTQVSLTSQYLLFIFSQIKLENCFGSHKILTGFVAVKVNHFFYAHHVA